MELLSEPDSPRWSFPLTEQVWEHTPSAVQAYLLTLHDEMSQPQEQVESLQARLHQYSTTSLRSPLSDSPYKKPRRCMGSSTRTRNGGGKPGHRRHCQVLLASTAVEELLPESRACGSGEFGLISSYYTHQVIELPRIEMEVSHWMLHQGQCWACGRWCKAQMSGEHVTGYSPRLSALMAEFAGAYGNGRRMVQTFCSLVLRGLSHKDMLCRSFLFTE